MNTFIFTSGDTNGIGPEISLRVLNKIYSPNKYKLVIPIPINVFKYYSEKIKIEFPYKIVKKIEEAEDDSDAVTIIDLGNVRIDLGKPTRFSGRASYRSIIIAHDLIGKNIGSAMITAPISKFAWQKAGI
ncbi:MAG: 4-hydroxythreonine-4-phosphate dehydrogenase PdxA, partial [Melioribacteraceae bacterium]|nr:4-hydroxythreonine-4-phosphate dehydrogenase PdxA [Melioribacteraceae bacterium]